MNAEDGARLSDAARTSLDELLSEVKSQIVADAARHADSELLSASDIVRAYYRVSEPQRRISRLSAPGSQFASRGSLASRTRWTGLFAVAGLAMTATLVAVALVQLIGDASRVDSVVWNITLGVAASIGVASLGAAFASTYRVAREREAFKYLLEDGGFSSQTPALLAEEPGANRQKLRIHWNGSASRELEQAGSSPSRVVLLERWMQIERLIDGLYDLIVEGNSDAARQPFGAKVLALSGAGILTPALNKQILSLLDLRNDLMHSGSVPLDFSKRADALNDVVHKLRAMTLARTPSGTWRRAN